MSTTYANEIHILQADWDENDNLQCLFSKTMSRTAIAVNTRSVDTGATITITGELSDELTVTGLDVSLGVLLSSTGLAVEYCVLCKHYNKL